MVSSSGSQWFSHKPVYGSLLLMAWTTIWGENLYLISLSTEPICIISSILGFTIIGCVVYVKGRQIECLHGNDVCDPQCSLWVRESHRKMTRRKNQCCYSRVVSHLAGYRSTSLFHSPSVNKSKENVTHK